MFASCAQRVPSPAASEGQVRGVDVKHTKKRGTKAASHKEVWIFLVGVDVLGDPLRQKMNRRKQRITPTDYKKSVGV